MHTGGDDEAPAGGFGTTPTIRYAKSSNAYMLVYLRMCDWDKIMGDIGEVCLCVRRLSMPAPGLLQL